MNIATKIFKLMQTAEKLGGGTLTGQQKKEYVLLKLRQIMPFDNGTEDLIISMMDLLIEVDKGKLTLNKRVKKSPIFMKCFK